MKVIAVLAAIAVAVVADTCTDVQAAVSQLTAQLIKADGCGPSFQNNLDGKSKNLAAMWIRNIFHDGGSWDASTNQFGLDGSIINEVFESEADGLGAALPVQNISGQAQVNPLFPGVQVPASGTPADLISIAGIAAINHCSGPQINLQLGRNFVGVQQDDGVQANLIPSDIHLSSDDLFAFFKRMGLSKSDTFALVTGSHTMGGVHRTTTPEAAGDNDFRAFDDTPTVFDNNIFVKLQRDPTDCVLPIDCNMAQDPELKFFLDAWANDASTFIGTYISAMNTMLTFNSNRNLSPSGGCPFSIARHNYAGDTASGNATVIGHGGVAVTSTTNAAATSVQASTTSVPASSTSVSASSTSVPAPPTSFAVSTTRPVASTTTASVPTPSVSPLKIVFNIDSNKNYFDTVNDVSGGILKTDRPSNIFYNMDRASCVGNDIAGTRSAFLGINNADKTNLNDFVRLIVKNNVGTATIPAKTLKAGSVTMYITCHGSDGKSTFDSNFGNNWPFVVNAGL